MSDPLSILKTSIAKLVKTASETQTPVTDAEIDKLVAEVVAKEAHQRVRNADTLGVRAYSPKTQPVPQTNKGFLLNVVKNVDSHNEELMFAERRKARERFERLERSEKDDRRGRTGRRRSRSRSPRRRADHHESNQREERKRKSSSPDEERREGSVTEEDERSDQPTSSAPQVRGRGKMGTSRMDKYFKEDYRPDLDFSDAEDSVLMEIPVEEIIAAAKDKKTDDSQKEAKKEKKKRKDRKKKEKKKEKARKKDKKKKKSAKKEESSGRSSSSSESSDSEGTGTPPRKTPLPMACPW